MAINYNAEISDRLQNQFEFYLVALVFAILGLSIQTASFGKSLWPDASELLGWLCFFFSGLAGLYRLELVPAVYEYQARIDEFQKELTSFHQGQKPQKFRLEIVNDKPKYIPVTQDLNIAVTQIKSKQEDTQVWIKRGYEIHRAAFILGLFMLLIARSWEPLFGIIYELLKINI